MRIFDLDEPRELRFFQLPQVKLKEIKYLFFLEESLMSMENNCGGLEIDISLPFPT